jgi:hypothetical protein
VKVEVAKNIFEYENEHDDEDEKTYDDEKLQAGMAYEEIQIRS